VQLRLDPYTAQDSQSPTRLGLTGTDRDRDLRCSRGVSTRSVSTASFASIPISWASISLRVLNELSMRVYWRSARRVP